MIQALLLNCNCKPHPYQENLRILRENGFDYLVNDSRRGRKAYQQQFQEEKEFAVIEGRPQKPPVKVRMITETSSSKEGQYQDRLILCKSEGRQNKEEAILSNAEQRFIEAVQKLSDRVAKGRIKEKEKIIKAAGSILGKHPRVARFYTINVEECQPAGQKAMLPWYKVVWSRKEEQYNENCELFGYYVLRTNSETDLSAEEIWSLYITLTRAEDGFRALKSNLGLRPNYHQKQDRVDGHIFITILAYHLLQFILYSLRLQGDSRGWETIKRILSTHCYTTIQLPTAEGEIHRIRKAGTPEEGQKRIYQSLGVNWKDLPVIASNKQKK